ncbi:hypothetical protein BASA61_003020 [Batrachochytrium salamandrivorans]|nr:hypothetical protein BASA61_003020 [Batrachochytrium salamandrivorans]
MLQAATSQPGSSAPHRADLACSHVSKTATTTSASSTSVPPTRTAIVRGGYKRIHSSYPDGRECIEDYDLKRTESLGGDALMTESASNPCMMRRDTRAQFVWRIRNLPWPKEVYQTSIDTVQRKVVVRTTNKKYFVKFSLPDMDRARLPLNPASLATDWGNNTLFIMYSKPTAILELEKAEREERRKMGGEASAKEGDVQSVGQESFQPISMYPHPSPLPSSYWLKHVSNGLASMRKLPASANIVVVGSGISGASTVLQLVQRWKQQHRQPSSKLRILLLDARGISGGATGRNGGLMWPGLLDAWPTLVSLYGVETTKHLVRFDLQNCQAMVEAAADIADTGSATSQLDPCMYLYPGGGINLLHSEKEKAAWESNIAAMQQGGCPDWGVSMWDLAQVRKHLPAMPDVVGAVHNKFTWRVRSGRLVLHLLKKALYAANTTTTTTTTNTSAECQDNVQLDVATHVLVERVERVGGSDGDHQLQLITSNGAVMADKVVYCTNAYSSALFPTVDITPVKNQVGVTTEVHPTPWDFAIKANSGYDYLSPREDGRIVLGGMRYLVKGLEVGNSDDGNLDKTVSVALDSYMSSHFPEVHPMATGSADPADTAAIHQKDKVHIQEEWAGIMGFTSDHMPLVGPIPDRSGEFICAGFSGHGIARAFLCGKAVADMVLKVDAASNNDLVDLPAVFLPNGRFDKPTNLDPSKLISKM